MADAQGIFRSFALGAVVRAVREWGNRSQGELAEEVGCARLVLGRIESGQSGGRIDTWDKIAAALGLRMGELLRRADVVELALLQVADPFPAEDVRLARIAAALNMTFEELERRGELFALAAKLIARADK